MSELPPHELRELYNNKFSDTLFLEYLKLHQPINLNQLTYYFNKYKLSKKIETALVNNFIKSKQNKLKDTYTMWNTTTRLPLRVVKKIYPGYVSILKYKDK